MSNHYWEGKLIRLRGVEPEDAEAHFLLNRDEEIARNIDQIYPPGSRAFVRQWAERTATRGFEDDEFSFQMETREGGELVGGIATNHCDLRAGTFSYGLHVLPEHRRKGYAAEAVCLVLRYYFQERRYQKANVGVYAFNEGSIALHERLGFTLEGRLRRSVYTRGQYFDLLMFGMTAEEFAAQHPKYCPAGA
jgi:RimJ/RimL family protein N-acetyltransferase